jgi:hypothetical protein
LDSIKCSLEYEGLGDLYDRIKTSTDVTTELEKRRKQTVRPQYEKSLDDFFLPTFVVTRETG